MTEEEIEEVEHVDYDDSEFDDQGEEFDPFLLQDTEVGDSVYVVVDEENPEDSYELYIGHFLETDELANESDTIETIEDNVIEEEEPDEEIPVPDI